MAVVIRLRRTGRRNLPCYRINVADSRSPRDGRMVENLGFYDPLVADVEKQVTCNVERASYWLDQGALPSETVKGILKRLGVYEGRAEPAKRTRDGRKRETKKCEERRKAQAVRKDRKQARFKERVAQKRTAAKAAAAAGGEESSES